MQTLITYARARLPFQGVARAITLVGTLAIFGCIDQRWPLVSNARADVPAAVDLSEEQCLAYARFLETSVQESDTDAFNDLIDWEAMVKAATSNLGLPEPIRQAFSDGVRAGLASQFADQIIGQVASGGDYRFIRVREMDGQKTVVFRLIVDSGMNYHEWLLTKSDDRVIASDVYVYLMGERMAQSVRRSALPLARQHSRSRLSRLVLGESAYIRHLDEMLEMFNALREGRYDEVLETYAQLPPILQRDKQVLVVRHQAAMRTSDADLLSAIEDFRRHHPDDACLSFILIDYYALREEHENTLASIDRLDASIGGDPYLNALRADTVYKMGDTSKAFELVDDAIEGAPDVVDAYWISLGLALMAKDHARTLRGLQVIDERFEVDLSGVDEMPEYAEFFESPQGKQWSAHYSSRRTDDDGQ